MVKKLEVKKYPLKKIEDLRGWMIQNDYEEIAGKMKHFILSFSKKGAIRGNHYHKRKIEWFCIVQGKARLYLYDARTKEKSIHILNGKNPVLYKMEPYMVHTLQSIGEEELIFFEVIDERFNPKDQDTFPYKLK